MPLLNSEKSKCWVKIGSQVLRPRTYIHDCFSESKRNNMSTLGSHVHLAAKLD